MDERGETPRHGVESYGVERHGVDTIPDGERTSRPRDLAGILVGGNLARRSRSSAGCPCSTGSAGGRR